MNSTTLEPDVLSTVGGRSHVSGIGDGDTAAIESIVLSSLSLMAKTNRNIVNDVSPVTLSSEWSRMARLLLLSCLAVIGSIGNVFMISSVMIEEHLKKAGNAFLVNIALADLVITSVLIPASTIVLLAGINDDNMSVCKVQWYFAACAFIVSVLSLFSIVIENYIRLCTKRNTQKWLTKCRTTWILLLIWFFGAFISGMQFVTDMNFDYCRRKLGGFVPYQATIVTLLILLPLLITFYIHCRIIIDSKRFMSSPNFKPNQNYSWDLALARSNFYSFIIFLLFWLPFGFVLAYGSFREISDRVFYNTAWIGLSKSCFLNVIYCVTNRHFCNAYISLFNYCCCKTTVAVSRRTRGDGTRPTADVRVHIIPGYNMYSYTSPQRAGNFGKREVRDV